MDEPTRGKVASVSPGGGSAKSVLCSVREQLQEFLRGGSQLEQHEEETIAHIISQCWTEENSR